MIKDKKESGGGIPRGKSYIHIGMDEIKKSGLGWNAGAGCSRWVMEEMMMTRSWLTVVEANIFHFNLNATTVVCVCVCV